MQPLQSKNWTSIERKRSIDDCPAPTLLPLSSIAPTTVFRFSPLFFLLFYVYIYARTKRIITSHLFVYFIAFVFVCMTDEAVLLRTVDAFE